MVAEVRIQSLLQGSRGQTQSLTPGRHLHRLEIQIRDGLTS
jgi:hypothetical protein